MAVFNEYLPLSNKQFEPDFINFFSYTAADTDSLARPIPSFYKP